jgi:hypothetical protein
MADQEAHFKEGASLVTIPLELGHHAITLPPR